MKVKKYDGTEERRILAEMVTNQTVCIRIASQWKDDGEGLFGSKWSNLVAGWCIKHVRNYNTAPNKHLRPIFDSWASTTKMPESTIDMVEDFLSGLSDEHSQDEQKSNDFILDMAGEHFNKIQIKRAMTEVDLQLDRGKVDLARSAMLELDKVELGEGALLKPSENFEIWNDAYNEEMERPLVPYGGKLTSFLNDVMVRDSFVAYMAPDKTGKSMMLLDAAYRGIRNNCKVAYFEVGDMSLSQVLKRLGQRASRTPKSKGKIRLPKSIDDEMNVKYEVKRFDEGCTARKGFKSFRKVCKGKDLFRLSCYPNSSMDILRIDNILRDWSLEGWVADVVVIDYADILAPPSRSSDPLEQIDMTWKLLRRMSQEHHCLVLTATQSSAAAYTNKASVLTKRHFSGRKTKLAHVNAMIGINVSPDDKKNGVTRLNFVVRRDGYFSENRYVAVAGCWDICSPLMKTAE